MQQAAATMLQFKFNWEVKNVLVCYDSELEKPTTLHHVSLSFAHLLTQHISPASVIGGGSVDVDDAKTIVSELCAI